MRIKAIVALVLCIGLAVSQAEEDPNVLNVDIGDQSQRQMTPEEQQRYFGMRRTACLVLARHHSNGKKDEVEGIVQGLAIEQQQKFINKMYATAVETCEQVIIPEEVQQLYVENPSFDATALFHVFSNVDYTAISKESFKLSKNQEMIVEYIKNFDQEMEVKREEKQAEEEKMLGDEKHDIKIFGVSSKDIGTSAKLIYVVIFAGIVGGLLYYGLRQLSKAEKPKKKKAKKDASPREASPSSPNKKKD